MSTADTSFQWHNLYQGQFYFPEGIYMNWGGPLAVHSDGFKFHVTAHRDHALMVARHLLPVLRENLMNHKVVKNEQDLDYQESGQQKGKLITIYCADINEFWGVVSVVDPWLNLLRREYGVLPGHCPTNRIKGGFERETPVGTSEMLFWRAYEGEQGRSGNRND